METLIYHKNSKALGIYCAQICRALEGKYIESEKLFIF
jgi:hypothetical protein